MNFNKIGQEVLVPDNSFCFILTDFPKDLYITSLLEFRIFIFHSSRFMNTLSLTYFRQIATLYDKGKNIEPTKIAATWTNTRWCQLNITLSKMSFPCVPYITNKLFTNRSKQQHVPTNIHRHKMLLYIFNLTLPN